jgi:hypothetical protein
VLPGVGALLSATGTSIRRPLLLLKRLRRAQAWKARIPGGTGQFRRLVLPLHESSGETSCTGTTESILEGTGTDTSCSQNPSSQASCSLSGRLPCMPGRCAQAHAATVGVSVCEGSQSDVVGPHAFTRGICTRLPRTLASRVGIGSWAQGLDMRSRICLASGTRGTFCRRSGSDVWPRRMPATQQAGAVKDTDSIRPAASGDSMGHVWRGRLITPGTMSNPSSLQADRNTGLDRRSRRMKHCRGARLDTPGLQCDLHQVARGRDCNMAG